MGKAIKVDEQVLRKALESITSPTHDLEDDHILADGQIIEVLNSLAHIHPLIGEIVKAYESERRNWWYA